MYTGIVKVSYQNSYGKILKVDPPLRKNGSQTVAASRGTWGISPSPSRRLFPHLPPPPSEGKNQNQPFLVTKLTANVWSLQKRIMRSKKGSINKIIHGAFTCFPTAHFICDYERGSYIDSILISIRRSPF